MHGAVFHRAYVPVLTIVNERYLYHFRIPIPIVFDVQQFPCVCLLKGLLSRWAKHVRDEILKRSGNPGMIHHWVLRARIGLLVALCFVT